MLEFPRWKYILIFVVLVLSTIYALPNAFPQDPAVQVAQQGGKVDAADTEKVRAALDAAKIPYKSVAIEKERIVARVEDTSTQIRAADLLRTQLGSEYTTALNLAPTVPAWLSALGAEPMTLGLDLRGGVHFLMQVDQAAALEKRETAFVAEVQKLYRDEDVRFASVGRDDQGILVTLQPGADRAKAVQLIQRNITQLTVVDAVDDGQTLRLVLPPAAKQQIADEAIEQNILGLRNRIASLAEPVIQRQGADRIIVELPGVQDTARAKEIMGSTATLEWRAVIEGNPLAPTIPPEARIYYQRDPLDPSKRGQPILLSKRLIVSGEQLVDARPSRDQQTGEEAVLIQLDSSGGKRMLDHTLDNVGKRMGIVYISRTPTSIIDPVTKQEVRSSITKEEVINAAVIRGTFGSQFQTTGLSAQEAKRLAEDIKAGALAAPMDFVEERVIGPSLGAENVRRGIQAVLWSFVFVMVFFVAYYKMFGIITNLALLMNLLLVVAVMSLPGVGATLSLPGFAGIALTVGMSVDANVLINERIREELRLGLTPLASIAAGYDKASGTIADANVTALLGGVAMAAFGSGPIKGFGITLIIGILTSMFTAVMVSRGIATLIYGKRKKLASISI
jgi:preprotein translocase subunit SecD